MQPVILWTAVALLVGAAEGQRNSGCLLKHVEFNTTTDYFPEKTVSDHSGLWAVTYHNFYKKVVLNSYQPGSAQPEVEYQLFQCFEDAAAQQKAFDAAPPCSATASVPCRRFVVPLKKVGVEADVKLLGIFEELGVVSSVVYADPNAVSPCLASKTLERPNATDATQLQGVDAFFSGSKLSGDKTVYAKSTEEDSPLGRAEWLELVAAFFNREGQANYMIAKIQENFDCMSHTARTAVAKQAAPRAAFITVTDTEYIVQNRNYERGLVEAAGGMLISSLRVEKSKAETFHAHIKDASVLVLLSPRVASADEAVRELGGLSTTATIYATDGLVGEKGGSDWEEGAIAAPDVVLGDFIKALHPTLPPWSTMGFVHLRAVSGSVSKKVAPSAGACSASEGLQREHVAEVRQKGCPTVPLAGGENLVHGKVDEKAFAPNIDYFPQKVSAEHAGNFTVTYHLTWKHLRNTRTGDEYVLVQRGVPNTVLPSVNVLPWAKRITVPVEEAGVEYTTDMVFLELLGVLTRVKVADVRYVTSPCIMQGIKEGLISPLNVSSTEGRRAQVEALGVHFTGGASETKWKTTVLSSATQDPGALNRAEWLYFFAVFFNMELTGRGVFDEIKKRYQCLEKTAGISGQVLGKKVVAFGGTYYAGGWQVSTAQYKTDYILDAGGIPAHNVEQGSVQRYGKKEGSIYHFSDLSAWHQALKGIDVIIDESYVASANGTHPATLEDVYRLYGIKETDKNTFTFLKNSKLFREDKRVTIKGSTDWFARAIVEGDAVLEDIVSILHDEAYSGHTTNFLRNVVAGEKTTIMDETKCKNFSRPESLAQWDTCRVICSNMKTKTLCEALGQSTSLDHGCAWADGWCVEVEKTRATLAPKIDNGVPALTVPLLLVALMLLVVL